MNCGHCIRAEGHAAIHLITEGTVTCEDALEEGIHTRGNAEIEVQAGERLVFSAAEDGMGASGNSGVHLSLIADDQVDDQTDNQAPDTPTSVTGGVVGINAQGHATIDSAGECTVAGTTENLTQSGNASVTTTCDI